MNTKIDPGQAASKMTVNWKFYMIDDGQNGRYMKIYLTSTATFKNRQLQNALIVSATFETAEILQVSIETVEN